MFFESILEEVNIDEPVSESTMEEIRQLSIPNFMESTLSPFDLVDKGIYENAKTYNDMVSKIGNLSNLNLFARTRIYSSILSSIIPKFPLSFNIDGTIQYRSPTNANKNNNIIKSELFL